MSNSQLLTKSKFMRAVQCPKAVWFDQNQNGLKPAYSQEALFRFETGNKINEFAHQCFEQEAMVSERGISQSAKQTEELIQDGERILFEATALTNQLYARIDILRQMSGTNSWEMIEVKSTNSVKEQHIEDLAFQRYVFTLAGYDVQKTSLMHLDRDYRRLGEVEPEKLFLIDDVTEETTSRQTTIPSRIQLARNSLTHENKPDIEIGGHCNSPYECDYKSHCWKHVPDYSFFNLFNADKAVALSQKYGGYDPSLLETSDWPGGKKHIDLAAFQSQATHMERDEICRFVDSLVYPLIYLDYETISPAVPLYDGLGTYAPVPFQFSAHTEPAPRAKISHRQFLHWQQTDPREEFIEALINTCEGDGSIIVYHAAFEKGRNSELAEQFPKYAAELEAINDRMVDLLIPFRNRWLYHPKQNGSASIKAVLPAFTDLTYADLDIGNGADASMQYLLFQLGKLSDQESEKLYSDLTAYCEMDTWAMKKLMDVLRSI